MQTQVGKSIQQTISWDTRIARDPSSLIYPMYLSPPSSYSNKAFRNRVLSSFPNPAIRPIASAKPHRLLLAIPQNFPSSKTLSTLRIDVGQVWVQISSQGMTMEEGRRRGYNDFSLRMGSSLSKRWVCVLLKTHLGFSSLNDLFYICG